MSAAPTRRRLPITPAGWALVALIVVSEAAGAWLGYEQLQVVAAAGLVTLVGAAAAVLWRPRVAVSRAFHPSTVVAGEPAVAVLEVTNQARWRSPPVAVFDRLGDQETLLSVRSMAAGQTVRLHYPLPTDRRARLTLGPLVIVRNDPLGLLEARQDREATDVLWVHPRTWPIHPLPAGVVVDLEGPVSDTAQAGSVTFASLREYVPGDDRRLIHWRSSARTGTLLVRHHVDTNEPRATIVLDARRAMWTELSFEDGVELCASVAAALTAVGLTAELRIVGEVPARMRELGALTLADRLSAVDPSDDGRPSSLLRAVEAGPGGGALVVVSGTLEHDVETRLSTQRRRHSPVVVCRVQPGRDTGWRIRSGVVIVRGPTAKAVAAAWNRMVVS